MNSNIPPFLLTHPVSAQRMSDAADKARQYPHAGLLKKGRSAYFNHVKIKLDYISRHNKSEVLEKYQDLLHQSPDNLLLKYAVALGLLYTGETAAAQKQLQELYQQHNNDQFIFYAYIQALIQNQQTEQMSLALQMLRHKLTQHPYHPVLSAYYVEVLNASAEYQTAAAYLQNYFREMPASAVFYRLLSHTQSRLGQALQARLSMAEAYYLDLELEQAVLQLEIAQKTSSSSTPDKEYLSARINARLKEIKAELKRYKEQLKS